MRSLSLFLAMIAAVASSSDQPVITLVSFSDPATSQKWSNMNDPVMGGQSHSTFTKGAEYGTFSGLCAIVPFLHAPGFCKIATSHGLFQKPKFADVSQFIGGSLYLEVKSSSPTYAGFKVAFSAKNVTRPRPGMHHAGPSFKADFHVPAAAATAADGFALVKVPFSNFSVDWSEFTGECSTKDPTGEQHVCCSAQHPEVCPKDYHLRQLTGFEIWAEGKEGKFEIDIKSIAAGP